MKNIYLSVIVLCSALVSPAIADTGFAEKLADAAIERTKHSVVYDPSYVKLTYPGGDVEADKGVCADVLIRVLRVLDIDLQKNIHEDMKANFNAYPKRWGLVRTDRNIDHRRVPNIETYFTRIGARLETTQNKIDYETGDIVAWNLSGHGRGWMPHIGIVSNQKSHDGTPLIVHNIGSGPQMENVLFNWPITGHYRLAQSQFE